VNLREFFEPPLSRAEDRDAAKLAWVVRLRWIALSAQLLSIPAGLRFGLLERDLLPVFCGIILGLALINLVTWRLVRRGHPVGQRQILLQLTADVVALSALLALTGGAWQPLFPLLFFHAGLGGLLLEGRVSVEFIWILMASILAVQALSHVPPALAQARVDPLVLFPAQLLVAGLFYLLSSWLSRTLTSLQAHFHALQERRVRIDRLRAIGALAAGLSHELATPLNTAMLRLERLARKHDLQAHPDLHEARDALDRCEDVLRHMAGSQLRPEGLQLEAVEVGELLAQLCKSLDGEDGAPLQLDAPLAARALAPPIALSQALLNLIDNAREASPAGETVRIELRADRARVRIDVCDRGSGWPHVVREHLGEPFVTTRPGGVGLGLYYVWTMASALGGELELRDRPGGGAVARLVLPAHDGVRAEVAR
jgi:two-component system sensor histidine kinase RegB